MFAISKKSSLLVIACLVTLGMILPGCRPANMPTADANVVYTSAAATVAYQLTQQGPRSTTAAPTALPTNPPATQAPLPTTAVEPTIAASAPAAPAVTAAPPGVPAATEKYELLSQDPTDNAQVPANAPFEVAWTVKNTGTSPWTKDFTLVFFVGERMGSGSLPNSYNFTAEVKPGETYTAVAHFVAPANTGSYMSWWKLKNKDGQNFGDVTITMVVVSGAAAPAATATSTVSVPPTAANTTAQP